MWGKSSSSSQSSSSAQTTSLQSSISTLKLQLNAERAARANEEKRCKELESQLEEKRSLAKDLSERLDLQGMSLLSEINTFVQKQEVIESEVNYFKEERLKMVDIFNEQQRNIFLLEAQLELLKDEVSDSVNIRVAENMAKISKMLDEANIRLELPTVDERVEESPPSQSDEPEAKKTATNTNRGFADVDVERWDDDWSDDEDEGKKRRKRKEKKKEGGEGDEDEDEEGEGEKGEEGRRRRSNTSILKRLQSPNMYSSSLAKEFSQFLSESSSSSTLKLRVSIKPLSQITKQDEQIPIPALSKAPASSEKRTHRRTRSRRVDQSSDQLSSSSFDKSQDS